MVQYATPDPGYPKPAESVKLDYNDNRTGIFSMEMQAFAIGSIIEEMLDTIYQRDRSGYLPTASAFTYNNTILDLIRLEVDRYKKPEQGQASSLAVMAILKEIENNLAVPLKG